MPKITVSIPIFNKEEFLAESIESVLCQDFEDFELLLIDDCSTDKSLLIAKKYEKLDNRIRLVENSTNIGNIANGNKCLDLANTDLVIRMDADDIMAEGRIRFQYDYMEKNKDIALSSGLGVNMNTNEVIRNFPSIQENLCHAIFPFKNPLSQGAAIFRKSLITQKGLSYDELGPNVGEDWLFFFKIHLHLKVSTYSKVLNHYRIYNESISGTRDGKYYADNYFVLKYILNHYGVEAPSKQALIYFKKQIVSKGDFNYETLREFKKTADLFSQEFLKTCNNIEAKYFQLELEDVVQWLFYKSCEFNAVSAYRRLFKINFSQRVFLAKLRLKKLFKLR